MRKISVCAVDGCENPVGRTGGQGYCRKHYARLLRHGDPLGGGIDYGAANKFVRDTALLQDVDECIAWPFGKNAEGRGRVRVAGKSINADVAVLIAAKGDKPTPKHECCHSCGNGHLGCVNPSHMYWGTRKENVADAIAHGTSYTLHVPTGEAHHCAKYSDILIDTVMRRLQNGERPSRVARDMGIPSSYIYSLAGGRVKRAQAWLAANDNKSMQATA
ncbi:hypothetical protein [Falsochrobactrum shanghaiense]|uniref:hypothetical protein n=1 Tax=Falsochrobactrum shanghaiense TaxID=2201899 RepID=UPI0011B2377F|nr:hypothetical protein [Falsochrobactrum shanghaiense]